MEMTFNRYVLKSIKKELNNYFIIGELVDHKERLVGNYESISGDMEYYMIVIVNDSIVLVITNDIFSASNVEIKYDMNDPDFDISKIVLFILNRTKPRLLFTILCYTLEFLFIMTIIREIVELFI